MGASDKYCCISATHWLDDPDKLLKHICDVMDWDFDDERAEDDEQSKIVFDPELVNGLRLKEEDMQAASDFILLCNFKEEDGERVVFDSVFVDQGVDPEPTFISAKNITARWHVEADIDATDTSVFYTEAGEIVYYENSFSFLVNYAAFLIVSGVSPVIKLHTLYDLLYHHSRHPWKPFSLDGSYYAQPDHYSGTDNYTTDPLSSINLGPLSATVGQEVVYAYLPTTFYEDNEGARQFWGTLLPDESISVADKLQEIWLGKGNFWCTSAPNKFPIAETLTSQPFAALRRRDAKHDPALARLPMDILLLILRHLPPQDIAALLQTCYALRRSLFPVANAAAYTSICLHRPHLFPVGPFELEAGCDRGREEIEYWVKEWAKGDYTLNEDDWKATKDMRTLPWLTYAREASKSPGMKNRRRIWGIGLQLEGMIEELQRAREDPPADFLPTL